MLPALRASSETHQKRKKAKKVAGVSGKHKEFA